MEGGGGGQARRAGFPDGSKQAVGVQEEHSKEPTEVRRGWSVSSVGYLVVVEGEGHPVLELGMSSKLLERRVDARKTGLLVRKMPMPMPCSGERQVAALFMLRA